MGEFYLALLLIGLGWLLLRVAIKPELIFEYPYFIAAVFVVFIIPQAFSLLRFPGYVSFEAVESVILMCGLCLLAAASGYKLSPSLNILRRLARPVDSGRLLHVGVFFILVSYFFTYLLMNAQKQYTEAGGMTGITTVYLFFVGLMFPGFAICLMLLLEKVTLPRLLMTLFGSVIPMVHILGARREPAAMFGITIMLGFYYARRGRPSRLVVFGALAFAMLAIPATGTYRTLASEGRMSDVRQLDMVGNFKEYFGQESVLELRNGAAIIEATRRFGGYDFGAGYWNQLVFRYVPAQLVGMERKNSFLIGTTVERMRSGVTAAGFEMSTGSTITGMGDAFQHFGWFGCLFFTLLGVIFRSIWLASLQPNAMFARLLYILICTSGMRAVTHQTVDFLPGLIYQFTFLSLGLLYAAKRPEYAVARRRRS